jgi:pilus assembly protein CpaB
MDLSKLRGVFQSNLVLGALAVTAGVLAAWLGARQLTLRAASLEQEARQRYATSRYIVASRDLSRGQAIDSSSLSIRSMPAAFAPADALTPESAGLLIGGRAAVAIRRGTAVVQSAVLTESSRERLSEQLPDGMRALTIQVDQLNALSGHLEAGDAVDLFYSHLQGNGAVLVPLLQRVRVLATGELTEEQIKSRPVEQQAGDFSSATLLVSAADAQRVVLAEQTGRLTLLLRRGADESSLDPRPFDSRLLLSPSGAGLRRSVRNTAPVELLIGGNGGPPARSWLSPGEGA